jgi:predicted ATPase/class 3 adenylate cyclase
MAGLPTGTVTFLFTDLVTSTLLWESAPEAMRIALERHDAIVRAAIESHDGYVFSTGGDGFGAAFGRVSDALGAATKAQTALGAEDWPQAAVLSARMGVHTGETAERDGDYFGPVVNRAARLMAVAHGGQVVCSRATADLAGSALPLRSLGEHRLRDLAVPQEVFQVEGGTFPPLRSLDAYPTNLPAQLTSFVGRERELKLVAESLRADRLVTLTGTGGVGKTRLALQAAAEAVPAFPDGAWLCELAAAPDHESMLGLVAATLGSVPRERTSLVDDIAEFVGDKRVLLILDNCEQLLDATAELAERLLLACRQIEILATSREALDVAGERVVRLRSLDVPELDAQVPASRLFIDRADAAGAGLELSHVDARAVAEVCRRLDGIPLAIELAAARTIAMSPSEIAARLDERFRLLTGGRRAAVERHQTLRATIDWSYSVLTSTEQGIFDCLGVFPTSFDAEAAQAVSTSNEIEAWDVIDALRSLVAKSLLTAEHSADGATRYQMLESLRHYARERLEAHGVADQARRRHAQHFAGLVDEFRVGVRGPDEQVWHARFRLEFENLRTAVLWGLDSAEEADGELALHILATTSGLLGKSIHVLQRTWDHRRTSPHGQLELLSIALFQHRSRTGGALVHPALSAPDEWQG